jgi:hypothetical protein
VYESSTAEKLAATSARNNLISLFIDRGPLASPNIQPTASRLNSMWKFIPSRIEAEITCFQQRW